MVYTSAETHSMWTRVDGITFNKFLLRAKVEKMCVDEEGRVDIGAIVSVLVKSYANGNYKIDIHPDPIHIVTLEELVRKDEPDKDKKEDSTALLEETVNIAEE